MKSLLGRSTALIIFGALAALEASDLMFLLRALGSSAGYAASLGLTPGQAVFRLVALAFLAAGITAASLAALYGLVRNAVWARLAGQVTAVLFILYGLFQVASAALVMKTDQTAASLSGAVFLLIGVALFPLGRRA